MVDLSVLPGFVAVILLFLAPPGPDMAYMLAVGLQGGRQPALKAILGIGTGMSVYAAAVVVGAGTVAQSYPAVLDAVRLLGAAYLLWLAVTTFRQARTGEGGGHDVPEGHWYLRGLTVSLTNPKIILFFLAVLPQFIGGAGNPTAQLALLGAINVATEVVLYGGIGLLAGTFHARFQSSSKAGTILSYIACGVYAALAIAIVAELLTRWVA